MTEEVEAHVLKKYEILQKLGTFNKLTPETWGADSLILDYRKGSLRYCLEGNWQEDEGDCCAEEELRCFPKCDGCLAYLPRDHFLARTHRSRKHHQTPKCGACWKWPRHLLGVRLYGHWSARCDSCKHPRGYPQAIHYLPSTQMPQVHAFGQFTSSWLEAK